MMNQLFRRKPIADLVPEGTQALKRVLGAGDLVMLAIGAVIGAGIFGAIGTAAAGQVDANGQVVRYAAGPALVFSFLLLGGACALAALCYAELAAMIPQAGSAYAYSYATLGEFVAWIIGWDLVLEYAVGNVAVAISWGDYFNTLLRGIGVSLPQWLTTGYRTARAEREPRGAAGCSPPRRTSAGIPILVNLPAFGIVMLVTWLLLRGAKESVRANNIMVVIKLLALALFVGVGATHLKPENYTPFAPNGFTGIHQGAAIVFFAYIGFDAISTAAEETRDPKRNLPIGILGGLAICTLIYVLVGFVLTGMVPYTELGGRRPAGARAHRRRLPGGRLDRGARRGGVDDRRPAGVPVRPAAHLLRDGARRAAAAVGGAGPSRRVASRTRRRSSPASWWRSRRSSATPPRPTTSPTSARCSPLRWCRSACWSCASPNRIVRGRSRCRSSGRSRCWAPPPACSSWPACRGRRGSASSSGWCWASSSTPSTATGTANSGR